MTDKLNLRPINIINIRTQGEPLSRGPSSRRRRPPHVLLPTRALASPNTLLHALCAHETCIKGPARDRAPRIIRGTGRSNAARGPLFCLLIHPLADLPPPPPPNMIMNILAGCNHTLLLYPRLEIPRMNPRMHETSATTRTVISFRVTKGFG